MHIWYVYSAFATWLGEPHSVCVMATKAITAKPAPRTATERSREFQLRRRLMRDTLRAIRIHAEASPAIRALADEALRGPQV